MMRTLLPGSESELPVGDWQKLEGMKTLFLETVVRGTKKDGYTVRQRRFYMARMITNTQQLRFTIRTL